MSIFTSRGCPYQCIFCHNNFGKKFRARSPENVYAEIKLLYEKYGVRELIIEDDNFSMDLERAKKICDLIIENDLDISIQFPNGIRADRMDEELMCKLSQSGTHAISIGIESGEARIQRLIRKDLNLCEARKTIALARKYRIMTNGFFMMGFPGETHEELLSTIKFAKGLPLDTADFSLAVPYPGTQLLAIAKEQGYLKILDYEKMDILHTYLESPYFTEKELKRLLKRAYIEFYFSPFRIMCLLRYIRLRDFKKYILGFIRHIIRGRY